MDCDAWRNDSNAAFLCGSVMHEVFVEEYPKTVPLGVSVHVAAMADGVGCFRHRGCRLARDDWWEEPGVASLSLTSECLA